MKALDPFEIWLITGSQQFYGDAVLRSVDEHSREVAASLDAAEAVPVRVVHQAVMTSSDPIRRLCLDANAAANCVGVICWMHTFSPAKMWIAGLGALQKPLLHLHTQFNRDLPWSEIDMDFMNLNQSAHGDREFGFMETRMRLRRKTVVGHWRDPAVVDRIATWARAACGWHEAQTLGVARFGDNMRHVAVTEGDKVEAQLRLGVSVHGYGIGELADAMRAVPDAAVDGLVDEYEAEYELVPALRRDGDRRESLRDAARIEAGLRGFLEAGGFKAFTDTFEDLDGLPQLPGIAVQRLMADGYGFGGEGDWKTAALVRIAKVMGAGLDGGASFMEDYTYHLAPDGPKVLGAHMLEVCPSIAAGKPSCEIHALSIGGKQDPVRLVFTAGPGGGRGSARPGRSLPSRRQRDRRGAAGRGVAAAPGRPGRVGAEAGLRDGRGGLAARRWPSPHRLLSRARQRGLRRPRRDRGARAPVDRRADTGERLQEGAALEPGVLPSGRRPLTGDAHRPP
jgi:L-arabinose isomerase